MTSSEYKVRMTFEPLANNVGDLRKPMDRKCFGSGESLIAVMGEYLMHDGETGRCGFAGKSGAT